MGYKFDLLLLKKDGFFTLDIQPIRDNNAWKISLEVMKFVYLHTTYALSVLIIGLKIICT